VAYFFGPPCVVYRDWAYTNFYWTLYWRNPAFCNEYYEYTCAHARVAVYCRYYGCAGQLLFAAIWLRQSRWSRRYANIQEKTRT